MYHNLSLINYETMSLNQKIFVEFKYNLIQCNSLYRFDFILSYVFYWMKAFLKIYVKIFYLPAIFFNIYCNCSKGWRAFEVYMNNMFPGNEEIQFIFSTYSYLKIISKAKWLVWLPEISYLFYFKMKIFVGCFINF